MEDSLYYSVSVALCLFLYVLLSSLRRTPTGGTPPLPPGPSALSAIGPLLFLGRSNFSIEPVIRAAKARYGPVFTLQLVPPARPSSSPTAPRAHRALVQRGAAFAGRPPAALPGAVFSSGQRTVTSAAYGPLWTALRRNLAAKTPPPLAPPRRVRRRPPPRAVAGLVDAIAGLVDAIAEQQHDVRGDGVVVVEGPLHRAVVQVTVAMCFGEGVVEEPALSRRSRRHSGSLRRRCVGGRRSSSRLSFAQAAARPRAGVDFSSGAYVDSLLGLWVPEEDGGGGSRRRRLTEGEVVSLCAEFLTAGADSTAAVAQWAMANLVARPEVQARLRAEIRGVVTVTGGGVVEEEQLWRMPYLRAVVLETLRRHPPGHFVLPHAATETTTTLVEGFKVPPRATVNFTVAEFGLDEEVWAAPMEFRPERFMPGGEGEDVDLTGSKEIKMMPFGVGRRMCPGVAMAMLHLQYLVANLVNEFEWSAVEGETVDFAEKQELSVVMRRPLRATVVRKATLRRALNQGPLLQLCFQCFVWRNRQATLACGLTHSHWGQ
ncbi:hypothetical protein PR202_ga30709 [Eleusine coracana subsp. coracana]|uniref:Uncharacterized protein n=1 Tax=Eleusine coracana subsp. coracana TaxID=191504 RepID=A0AAV5DQC6_ELECO|nr:hypothetical protein PR202_ga30709 [Eleusine coracana subsp. coracana]